MPAEFVYKTELKKKKGKLYFIDKDGDICEGPMCGITQHHPPKYQGGENICTDLLFSFQHHIQMLDDGDLLFFDNGNLSQMLLGDSNPTSRIRRIRVIDDSYCETVWEYDLLQNLYGSASGSVQLLENGNYFIYTLGDGLGEIECTILEITPEDDMVWKVTIDGYIYFYRAYKIPSIHPNAFSVLFDQYRNVNIEGNPFTGVVLDDANSSLSFTIHNQSGYSQPYTYILRDSNGWFGEISDTITVEAYEHFTVTLEPAVQIDSVIFFNMDIWPIHHEYALKSINSSFLGINFETNIPKEYALHHNYPNPFNSTTTISFSMPISADVKLIVYDIIGNEVSTILNQTVSAGVQTIIWNAQDHPSGVYFIRMERGAFVKIRKVMLLI
jgi:hypothetical protein